MKMPSILSPLSLNPLTRDLWGSFDASILAQMAPLNGETCYQQKFYKAPNSQLELFAANGFVAYGLKITPGSVIYGIYLPMIPTPGALASSAPGKFTVLITDTSLEHEWSDIPISSLFLSNYKPTQQSNLFSGAGSFANYLDAPYPVTGSGVFMVEIQESSGSPQRIELVFGVLEVCQSI
jgi:hypothetical protein